MQIRDGVVEEKQNWPLCCQRPSSRDWRQANRLRDRASIRLAWRARGRKGPSSCDIAHGDIGGAARLQIQVVAAGGGQGDQAQFGQLGQFIGPDAHLVDDGDAGALEPLHHLIRRRGRVALPVMGKIRARRLMPVSRVSLSRNTICCMKPPAIGSDMMPNMEGG
jgi:hypothetical protein